MNDSVIDEIIIDKMRQYRDAIRLRCYYVAKARLRDVAHLQYDKAPGFSKEVYFKRLLACHPELKNKIV